MKTCSELAWLCWIEGHPGLASWLQAIGSLLALVVAFFVPFLMDWRRRTSARRADTYSVINAMAMAAGAANAFCTGLATHGNDEGFGDAFPAAAFDHSFEALTQAIPAANRLEINVLPVVTARLRFDAFVKRTVHADEIRAAGRLTEFIEFMIRDADGLRDLHDQVRTRLISQKRSILRFSVPKRILGWRRNRAPSQPVKSGDRN